MARRSSSSPTSTSTSRTGRAPSSSTNGSWRSGRAMPTYSPTSASAFARSDFDGALARFREAEKVAPDHWQARFNELVVLAIDLGDFETAAGKLGELEALAPGNADVARLAEEIRRRRTAS
ncbi:MAG: hypothetical protein R2862_05050 [Thermoanaerobaculia bacterium]